MERTVILCVLMMAWWIKAGAVRLAGGDVSLLPEYEEAGANYYRPEGDRSLRFSPGCMTRE